VTCSHRSSRGGALNRSRFIPPRTHGSKSIRASKALGTPSSGSCVNQTLSYLQARYNIFSASCCALFDTCRYSMATRCPKPAADGARRAQRAKTGQRWSNCAERRAAGVAGFGFKDLAMAAADDETERVLYQHPMFVSRVAATPSRSARPAHRCPFPTGDMCHWRCSTGPLLPSPRSTVKGWE